MKRTENFHKFKNILLTYFPEAEECDEHSSPKISYADFKIPGFAVTIYSHQKPDIIKDGLIDDLLWLKVTGISLDEEKFTKNLETIKEFYSKNG